MSAPYLVSLRWWNSLGFKSQIHDMSVVFMTNYYFGIISHHVLCKSQLYEHLTSRIALEM
jgi:hypothetical protein